MKKIPYKETVAVLSAAKQLLTDKASDPSLQYNLAADMGLVLEGLYNKYCPSGRCQIKDDILIAEFLNPEQVSKFDKYCKGFFGLCSAFTMDLRYNFYLKKIQKKDDGAYSVAFNVVKELA